jgi:membrane protein
LLFSVGKFLIGLYLGRSTVASTYGAAASLVVFMLWVYYSTQIVLFGAELTQAWVTRHGRSVQPKPNAEPIVRNPQASTGRPSTTH